MRLSILPFLVVVSTLFLPAVASAQENVSYRFWGPASEPLKEQYQVLRKAGIPVPDVTEIDGPINPRRIRPNGGRRQGITVSAKDVVRFDPTHPQSVDRMSLQTMAKIDAITNALVKSGIAIRPGVDWVAMRTINHFFNLLIQEDGSVLVELTTDANLEQKMTREEAAFYSLDRRAEAERLADVRSLMIEQLDTARTLTLWHLKGEPAVEDAISRRLKPEERVKLSKEVAKGSTAAAAIEKVLGIELSEQRRVALNLAILGLPGFDVSAVVESPSILRSAGVSLADVVRRASARADGERTSTSGLIGRMARDRAEAKGAEER
jgi:hypothetical protein